MRILFTICGRAGSKGIKNKNLRVFCGRYLAHYTVSIIDLYLKKHPETECDIVVNSDSDELIKLVLDNGLRKIEVINRDESLSGDSIGKIDVINDCLSKMEESTGQTYDMVLDLDITSPLRTIADLEKVIETQRDTGADVTTTVAEARRNPYFNQVMRTEHGVKKVIESDYTARQQAPEIFDMNASIYAYSPEYLRTGKGVLNGYCEIVKMYDTGILDLDHENDFELMEVIAEYLFKKMPEFKEIRDNIVKI
ncbi:MAG: acylneuraminate cytidylyltransferase family protein [Lachnospiraceae bacterium]|nr:acylneuraminate cytidylyltransferase family protein [Lachnospiraceae bacterium]